MTLDRLSMTDKIPREGSAYAFEIIEKLFERIFKALREIATTVNASGTVDLTAILADIAALEAAVTALEAAVDALEAGHNFLSAMHPDTTPAAPLPGALVVGVAPNTGVSEQFWYDGGVFPGLATALDPGDVAYWFNGLPLGHLLSIGALTKWERLDASGAAPGSVPLWDGVQTTWQVPGSSGSGGTAAVSVGVLAYRATDLTVTISTDTPVPLSAVSFDTHAFWSAGDPTKLIVPTGRAGVYIVTGQLTWDDAGGTRNFTTKVHVNSSERAKATRVATNTASGFDTMQVAAVLALDEGDEIELIAYWQEGAGTFDLKGGEFRVFFQLVRIG